MSEKVIRHAFEAPNAFTQAELGWEPWLEPLPLDELTERHYSGLVDKGRANSSYFRLLVRDPDILGARTRTDNDIFYNEKGGLPRAQRELSAAAASRTNGCIFCASVHSRFATHRSKRHDDVQRLLDEGPGGQQDDPQWRAVIDASVDLTRTPGDFDASNIRQLREAGLDDLAIADAIHGAAFFNWANRLMLSLGEPTPPTGS
ncbi:alkylhydroperoxidase domain protein [Cryobacterium breve]|uniref:Alkylhydroperoxidase domain protein n=1 Tax=Cryobacterium breve TaxID=1259258 RepID=A0ABY7NE48_9MICO|nr:alkylhydroperoxidase domain protein [Cryobacterium breve]WBM78823.1 alkylhydroperoxidase domain protein [Cryobacterium breve]